MTHLLSRTATAAAARWPKPRRCMKTNATARNATHVFSNVGCAHVAETLLGFQFLMRPHIALPASDPDPAYDVQKKYSK